MDLKKTPVGRRTRLQESLLITKYYEEKNKAQSSDLSDKKKRKIKGKDVNIVIVDDDVEFRNNGSSKTRGAKLQVKKGENVGSIGSNSKQKKGENCVIDDNNDDDIVFLREEVVSNGSTSKVPSSLGSGMNSGCVTGKRIENINDADEVVSSSVRKVINEGVSKRLRSSSSKITKEKTIPSPITSPSPNVFVLSSSESDDSGPEFEELQSKSSCEVDESLDDLNNLNNFNSEEEKDEEINLKKETFKDSVMFIDISTDEDEELVKEDEFLIEDEDDEDEESDTDSDSEEEEEEEDSDSDSDYDDESEYESDNNEKMNVKSKSDGKLKKEKVELKKRKAFKFDAGLERRRSFGLDLLIDTNNTLNKSIAERIRKCPRRLSKSRKKKLNLGKYSCPLLIPDEDDHESESESSESEREVNYEDMVEKQKKRRRVEFEDRDEYWEKVVNEPKKRSNNVQNEIDYSESEDDYGNNEKLVNERNKRSISESEDESYEKFVNEGKKRSGKSEKVVHNRKKRRHVNVNVDYFDILADSIFEEENKEKKELPVKFSFEDEKPPLPEKSIWEKETDALFTEMEFVITAGEINSSSTVDEGDVNSSASETSPFMNCKAGKHDLILDEPIGLKCKYCSFVQLEMKYIFPPFAKDPFRKCHERKGLFSEKSDCSWKNVQWQNPWDKDHNFTGNSGEGTVWDVIPGKIKEKMFPHQIEGFEFIWKNLGEGMNIDNNAGKGCIISHAPGTGKTFLAITFLLSFMRLYPSYKPVIIAPCAMLLTWEEEIEKWNKEFQKFNINIQYHNVNKEELAGNEHKSAPGVLEKLGKVKHSTNYIRLLKLYSWMKSPSVLIIGYHLFERLTRHDPFRKILLEQPGVLVLDEGHTPRNDKSLIFKALSQVKTKRRIILSGTPFQNNFDELYNTLSLVNPEFLTDEPSHRGHSTRGRPRKNLQNYNKSKERYDKVTSSIGKNHHKMDEFKDILDPFMHVYKGSILEDKLPGLKDSMLVLRPTNLQTDLLTLIAQVNEFRRAHLVSCISIHPTLVANEPEFINRSDLKELELDYNAGVKTKFIIEFIRLAMALHEKVLVFGEYLDGLTFIMKQLESTFGWCEGREVLYIHGQCSEKQRQSSISSLNDVKSDAKVLIASINACSEGINLVGASRVILVDVAWNPSRVRQAISRAYRLGQEKVVYAYNLISAETTEVHKFASQSYKDRLSKLVFSEKDKEGISKTMKKNNPPEDSEDQILEMMVQHKNLNFFERILQRPSGSNFDLD